MAVISHDSSCLSPWAKMPVTDTDTVWIQSGQQLQTLGSDVMTFCDIFVRCPHVLFLACPKFGVLETPIELILSIQNLQYTYVKEFDSYIK